MAIHLHQLRQYTLTTFSLLILLASTSVAQTPEEVFEEYFKDWYQVEIIIFERIEQNGSDPESWPKNVSLTYPARYEFLVGEEQEPLDENEETENESGDNSALLQTLKQGQADDPLNKKIMDSITKAEMERMTPKEKPFVLLDSEYRTMNDDSRRVGRDRAMRVLFHEAWRQPFTDQDSAPSIIINGGDAFDENYELEGSIKLFVSRYLHIHTDLWLTHFEANIGQESEHWPMLPKIPTPIEFDFENADSETAALENPDYLNTDVDVSLTSNTRTLDLSLNQNQPIGFSTDTTNNQLFDDYSSLTQKLYIVKHIVTMNQKRRMRSSELHYIDHPKLGVLIKIDKYEPSQNAEG